MKNKHKLDFWRRFIDGDIQCGKRKQQIKKLLSEVLEEQAKKGNDAFDATLKELFKVDPDYSNIDELVTKILDTATVEDLLGFIEKFSNHRHEDAKKILDEKLINRKMSCSKALDGPLQSWVAFENERNFLMKMVEGYVWLKDIDDKADIFIIKILHKICLSDVKNTCFDANVTREYIGKFRDDENSLFRISLDKNVTPEGIKEYFENCILFNEKHSHRFIYNHEINSNKFIFAKDKIYFTISVEEIDFDERKLRLTIEPSSIKDESDIKEIYQKFTETSLEPKEISKLFMEYFFENKSWVCWLSTNITNQEARLDRRVINALYNYYEALETIETTYDDKEKKQKAQLEATVRLIRYLAILHPFADGVGRTIVLQLLFKLLRDIDPDFDECIFENPNNRFDLCDFKMSMQEVLEGLERAKNGKFEKTTEELLDTLSEDQKEYFFECYALFFEPELISAIEKGDIEEIIDILKPCSHVFKKKENRSSFSLVSLSSLFTSLLTVEKYDVEIINELFQFIHQGKSPQYVKTLVNQLQLLDNKSNLLPLIFKALLEGDENDSRKQTSENFILAYNIANKNKIEISPEDSAILQINSLLEDKYPSDNKKKYYNDKKTPVFFKEIKKLLTVREITRKERLIEIQKHLEKRKDLEPDDENIAKELGKIVDVVLPEKNLTASFSLN